MSKGIDKVIEAWKSGNSAKAGNVSTDGVTLYSYALPIARRYSEGRGVHILDTRHSPSVTTSKHVNCVKKSLTYYTEVDDIRSNWPGK